jgi:predicted SAM-dependent methyltransferase
MHFIALRAANRLRSNQRKIAKRLALDKPSYLNLGSGPRGRVSSDWINVDGYKDTNVEFLMDLNRRLIFPDNCFDGIFCEHVLEHFDHGQGAYLLKEAWRVLSPGGCIRIVVPDGETIMKTYFESPDEFASWRTEQSGCAMEAVNSFFRQGYEHQLIYDWCLLANQLSRAGYVDIKRVSFQKGEASQRIILDDEKYQTESLYVEAQKPRGRNA